MGNPASASRAVARLHDPFRGCSTVARYASFMSMTVLLALLAAPMGSPPMIEPPMTMGGDQRRGDQMRAYQQRKEGNLSLREIEQRVVPTMRDSQYIGFDYDAQAAVYTLKFLRNGTVIWVEVDGRTGKVIGRTDG